jgi:uncharacterized protein
LVKRSGMMSHLREFIWPSMGLVATGRWALLKLLRQTNKPHYVARGAALGVVVSFFPILGTHTLLIGVLGYVFSASFVAAMLFSMLANPWTLPFMWASSHKLGVVLVGAHAQVAAPVTLDIWKPETLVQDIPNMLETILWPTMVGGFVIAMPLALFVYVLVYWRLQARRAKQRV